jgi:tetratricopeptide (TPR) repeat protein
LAARGSWHRQNAFPEAAREDWQNALVLTPDLTTPIRGLARLFVLGPVPLRDAPRGLVLAWKAIERQPKDAEMLTVLAIAYSRMGRHHEALDTIEKILPEAQGPLAYYCRALCKHRLGDATGAAADLKAGQDQHGRVYKNLPTPQADELRMAQLECQTALTTVSKPKSGER